jgi:hypothetical protein
LATLGMILLADTVETFVSKYFGKNVFVADFSASLSAQVFVLPLISYNFDTVNLISPLVNSLVLWTIPLVTVLGFFIILSTYIHAAVGIVIVNIYILVSSVFVNVVFFVDRLSDFGIEYSMPLVGAVSYFCILLALTIKLNKPRGSATK